MKNAIKLFGIIALIAIIGFGIIACGDKDDPWTAEYAIGDTGPGGGKIFYVSEAGFTMTDDGTTAHYLEAAPADMSEPMGWDTAGSGQLYDVTGTGTAIGTGRKNTALIIEKNPRALAAKECDEYSNGGKTDWFLPSKDELNELYKSKDAIGMIIASSDFGHYYWSSSQNNSISAWNQSFRDGGQNYYSKGNTCSVRAVRAFKHFNPLTIGGGLGNNEEAEPRTTRTLAETT